MKRIVDKFTALKDKVSRQRLYRLRHPEKCRAYDRAYQKTDKRKAYYRAYQKTDKYKAYQKAYRKTDKYKAYRKAYCRKNKKEKLP